MNRYDSIPHSRIAITGGFWAQRQKINRQITIESVMRRFQDTGRFDAFKLDWREGMDNPPHIFWDSDIAKWMESVAYLLREGPLPECEKAMEEVIDRIEAGQGRDGYFNIYFTNIEPSKRFQQRWAHELYCAGHMIEAAVAYDEVTGRDRLLKLMLKYVELIDRVFRREQSAAFLTPGHEEIELALIRLYRHTGDEKHLTLARWFIDRRGDNDKDDPEGTPEHALLANQSHLPVRKMATAEGHSVRAGYLYSAMADLARETGDEALLSACRRIFDNILLRRMYVTGGVGSAHHAEAFTVDWDLPNETAYAETCAAIALAYFARRMLTVDADSRYAEVVETVLYNGFLSGVSLDGKRFFYSNPLAVRLRDRGRNVSSDQREWLPAHQRVEVFSCSCCPPNVTRVMATLGDYLYTAGENRLYVHQFMESDASFALNGRQVRARQETRYPLDGEVRLRLEGAKGLEVAVRIPLWCRSFTLSHPHRLEKGYAIVACGEDDMDILLSLSMEPELIEAHPQVQSDTGRVALRRGPVIYCLEGVDNPGCLSDLMVDARLSARVEDGGDFLLPILRVKGFARPDQDETWLYRPFDADAAKDRELVFIPYYAFANRGESDMQVWTLVRR